MSSKAAVEFPGGVQNRTTIAVYLFGTAIRGQKYNSEFRFGRWKFCKIRPRPFIAGEHAISSDLSQLFRFVPSKKQFGLRLRIRYIEHSICRLRSRQCRRCRATQWAHELLSGVGVERVLSTSSRPTARWPVGLSFYGQISLGLFRRLGWVRSFRRYSHDCDEIRRHLGRKRRSH